MYRRLGFLRPIVLALLTTSTACAADDSDDDASGDDAAAASSECRDAGAFLEECEATIPDDFYVQCDGDHEFGDGCAAGCWAVISGCYAPDACTTAQAMYDCVVSAYDTEACLCA
jgi:hypothetical protein